LQQDLQGLNEHVDGRFFRLGDGMTANRSVDIGALQARLDHPAANRVAGMAASSSRMRRVAA